MNSSLIILRLIYSLLYSISLIFLLPSQYRKRPKEFRQRWLREKFGFFDRSEEQKFRRAEVTQPHSSHYQGKDRQSKTSEFPVTSASKLIWIHAVSVGEVMAAIPLLYRLKKEFPSYDLTVSTITDTGQKVAIEKVPPGTQVIYLPFDLIFILNKAIKNIMPALFIAMETELWPNLFVAFKKHNIPLIIMNGRLSEKSFKGYLKIRFFMRGILSCVDIFGMQYPVYAQRIKELGAPENKIKAIGSFKFDIKPSENIPEWTKLLLGQVIIAGSTHREEEDIIISVFIRLKNDFPDLNLIIAPRHPERFGEVEELVKKSGVEYIKRSELAARNEAQKSKSNSEPLNFRASGLTVILDAVGELASVYAVSDIAIIGGSLIPHGGQNLLEPAYWGKPIICGPHMENFPFIEEFYEQGAAIKADRFTLYDRLKDLLASSEKRGAIGSAAKELFAAKAGAVDRAIIEIKHILR